MRIGRVHEGLPLLARGRDAITLNPARVVYLFHLAQALETVGDRQAAIQGYHDATVAFPGTRLASEARVRMDALAGDDALFRGTLPEPPAPSGASSYAASSSAPPTPQALP
ncbi:MAG: hypothetical protein R3B09_03905 [Nannocystaceae bacterium]